MHFNIAVPLAFMRALKDSNIKVIEPIAKYSVVVPKEYLNITINSLSSFNSHFEIIDYNSERVKINGAAKYSDMLNFSNTLVSVTSGL